MPVVDMPLHKLKEYNGTNSKPTDFDSFWNERVLEAYDIELDFTIEESEITGYSWCKYYDLWFKGIDGGMVYAKYIHPNIDEKVPLILQFHGYPGASRSWFEQSSFAGMGCAVLAMDCPGQGGKGEDLGGILGTTVAGHIVAGLDGNPKDMYYVRLFQNTCILTRIAKKLKGVDLNRIYANGASQGGAIALVCTSLNKEIKRCAALYPFLSDYKRVWDMDLDQIAYEGIRYYSKWFDPMHLNEEKFFEKLGYIDVHNFANRIEAEILFGTGLIDNICPPSTQFAIFNNIKSKKEQYLFYDYSHEEISTFDDMLIDFFLKEDD